MVGIVDYGMGNLLSVFNALEMIGADAVVVGNPAELDEMERIILPGVGAFGDSIQNLIQKGFRDELNRQVLDHKKPIFGICLGMQVMAGKGYEFGSHAGLGWFDAEVVSLKTLDPNLRVPHVGWNDLNYNSDVHMFRGLASKTDAYFVHSFYMKCNNPTDVVCTVDYGGPVTAAVMKGNIFATQFHPEKSQDYGLKILENFLTWYPA